MKVVKRNNSSKLVLLTDLLAAIGHTAMAQVDPNVTAIQGAATEATTAFNAFAGLTVTAFIIGMVITYARKAKR